MIGQITKVKRGKDENVLVTNKLVKRDEQVAYFFITKVEFLRGIYAAMTIREVEIEDTCR